METRSGRPRLISRFESDKDTFTAACLHNREELPNSKQCLGTQTSAVRQTRSNHI